MKLITILLLIFTSGIVLSQDLKIKNNPYDDADEITKSRKAFQRERWFYEQRMYPYNYIPKDAYQKAYEQREAMRSQKGFMLNNAFNTWKNLGPTTGFYFAYSNITSRMPTVKYDPNNGNIIYVGAAYGGVWKTTDGGITWSAKSDNEVSLSSGALAIDPNNSDIIYYGTGEATYSGASYYGRGLLKSTDGGNTWTHYNSGLESYSFFSRIAIRPGHSNELLAALGNRTSLSVGGGLYRSTNGGQSWISLFPGRCDDVIFSPSGDTAYAVGSGTGYLISTNGGSVFFSNSSVSMGTRHHLAVAKTSPNILYFARHTGSSINVFKSTNAGFNFTQIVSGQNFSGSQAWYDFYMHVSPFDADLAFVGAIDVWRTTNGGTSNFTNVTNGYSGGNVHVDQHNVDFHPADPNQMVCVNDGGIWKSTDKGSTWINLNNALTLTQFYRIASNPSNADQILGGTQDNGTQQTFGSLNWSAAYGGDGGEVCFHAVNNNYILGETQNNGVFRSTNGGSSFSSATSGLSGSGSWVGPLISHPDSAGIFYTARALVFKTTNWAQNWFSISSGTSGTIREMAICKSSPEIMYATSGSSIYRSTNRGYNFSNVTTGLPSRTITSVYAHPDSGLVAIITFSGFGTGKIYKTTNGGASWFNISGNLPDSPANDALIYYPGTATSTYFIAMDIGVFVTGDYGNNWFELSNGLPNTVALHLDFHTATNKLRIGTHGRGVWEIQLDGIYNISVIPQGFMNTTLNKLNMTDTVSAYLRTNTSPYNIVDSAKAIIDSLRFSGSFVFANAMTGNYYIVIKHRNSIETWSKSPGQSFTNGGFLSYDFTSSGSQAFGSNQILVGSRYCIFNGDVNQNGIIDGSDLIEINNDSQNFISGYVDTDLTGDRIVDASDSSIGDNNASNFVIIITP